MTNLTDVLEAVNSTILANSSDVSSTSTLVLMTTTALPPTTTTTMEVETTTSLAPTIAPSTDSHSTATSIAFISLVIFAVMAALVTKIIISHKKKRAELIGGSARWRISASRQSGGTTGSGGGNGSSSATYLPMGRGTGRSTQHQPLTSSLDHPTADRLDWERQFFDDSEATATPPSRLIVEHP